MRDTLNTALHARELTGPGVRNKHWRKLYRDRQFIADLDIVNELDGHSGCVNALAWSKSGNLLASGSDDQHLNIHTYQPAATTNQFQLTTTVATGHTQNIFSVKFMPHQNDRIVVTAAGDGEVRIFDLEYSGQARSASARAGLAMEGRRRGRNHIYSSVRYLSDGDTDSRVFRSHGDRVKRIVTESSPYLFLTCSEDGEVRQWDLRQPSTAYPSPRSGNAVPPPLISYKRYQLDLNSISCSPSQPHYIALGGAHLHAFLHDRRMAGRDRRHETGKPLSGGKPMNADDEELMSQATQCVRRFAPKGQRKMKRSENGHITACKISDARPDEMVVSWSGDHIYSFDLVRQSCADDGGTKALRTTADSGGRVRQSRERKRKRRQPGSDEVAVTALGRPRTASNENARGGATLRVRYQNGQSEDISLPLPQYSEREREAHGMAKNVADIRRSLFDLSASSSSTAQQYTQTLGHCASMFAEMDEAIRTWRYPLDPTPEEVVEQQCLRRDRSSAHRFVQAAGTLARALGGRLQTPSGSSSPLLAPFTSIHFNKHDVDMPPMELFGYDFLKALLLWLESGIGRLVEGFTRPVGLPRKAKAAARLPIFEEEASVEAIQEILIPYLLRLASDRAVLDVDRNRFLVDEERQLFASERDAVEAFAAAVRIPFADLSAADAEGGDMTATQDRAAAMLFWGGKVARGVLMNAAEGVSRTAVERAFGGVIRGTDDLAGSDGDVNEVMVEDDSAEDGMSLDAQAQIGSDDTRNAFTNRLHDSRDIGAIINSAADMDESEDEEDVEHDHDEENDHDNEPDSPPSSADDEEDNLPSSGFSRFTYASTFSRRRKHSSVEAHVPCSGPTRLYRGHCNVKTVKDVSYLGPDDEYVVSGSDDGNVFIWDRRTAEMVNLLEGDGEVVNVVQAHPYEPCVAVSGIDHTIKIFSPDGRARESARMGLGVTAHDAAGFSSLAWPARLGRRQLARRQTGEVTSEPAVAGATRRDDDDKEKSRDEDDDAEYVAPNGLASRKRMHDAYRIMTKNDLDRQEDDTGSRGGEGTGYLTMPHSQLLQLIFGNFGNAGVLGNLE